MPVNRERGLGRPGRPIIWNSPQKICKIGTFKPSYLAGQAHPATDAGRPNNYSVPMPLPIFETM